MAITYADQGFNITDMVVCAMAQDGTFTGTPVRLASGQECSIEPASEAFENTGYGRTSELATVVTHAEFSLGQGAIDYAAYAIIAGTTNDEYGTTPNQYAEVHKAAGGRGLPYFALIGKMAAIGGASILVGLPRAKLDTVPSFTMTQNEFIVPEAAGKSIYNKASTGRFEYVPFILKPYETTPTIALTVNFFDDFFDVSSS